MPSIDIAALSPEQRLEIAVQVIRSSESGKIPRPVFAEIAKKLVMCTVELVPLRVRGETIDVLLTERSMDDPWWPGKWHVPGTMMFPDDEFEFHDDFSEPLERLLGKGGELDGGVNVIGEPVVVGPDRRVHERGHEFSLVHYVQVSGESEEGRFFPAEKLPESVPGRGMIDFQVGFIQRAVKRFRMDNLRNGPNS